MSRETPEQCKSRWTASMRPLIGRTIVEVRWMTEEDQEAAAWDRASVVILLDDGTVIYPSSDDEGNDAGALFISPSDAATKLGLPEVAPVI